MHITTQNKLPHIKLPLICVGSRDIISLDLLYDTGAALNTGYFPYYQQIMKRHPSLVAKFEVFDGNNPFDPIKLCGTITDPVDYSVENMVFLMP